jgi:hypothetical protein
MDRHDNEDHVLTGAEVVGIARVPEKTRRNQLHPGVRLKGSGVEPRPRSVDTSAANRPSTCTASWLTGNLPRCWETR